MLSLFLKSLLGALAVLLIALLSRSKSFFIAGLVPLFPTFALIAHYLVGTERTMADLRVTALFGLYSLLPYAAYLLAVYWFSYRFSLFTTLAGATLVWGLGAAGLLLGWMKYYSVAA
ncbi:MULTISPECIES: GlpM family protein [Oceanimonas]|uniref:GlpM family protein n=1 Tax=Oceanimonas smirnovii TaxID=264574 RepID=A0ABW7P4V3_9GAMM|nr:MULTISPECIES: GlpM family protein [Oceanimonas]MDV2858708.1 GlpM family protein [Oceanimonas sp. CAM02]